MVPAEYTYVFQFISICLRPDFFYYFTSLPSGTVTDAHLSSNIITRTHTTSWRRDGSAWLNLCVRHVCRLRLQNQIKIMMLTNLISRVKHGNKYLTKKQTHVRELK